MDSLPAIMQFSTALIPMPAQPALRHISLECACACLSPCICLVNDPRFASLGMVNLGVGTAVKRGRITVTSCTQQLHFVEKKKRSRDTDKAQHSECCVYQNKQTDRDKAWWDKSVTTHLNIWHTREPVMAARRVSCPTADCKRAKTCTVQEIASKWTGWGSVSEDVPEDFLFSFWGWIDGQLSWRVWLLSARWPGFAWFKFGKIFQPFRVGESRNRQSLFHFLLCLPLSKNKSKCSDIALKSQTTPGRNQTLQTLQPHCSTNHRWVHLLQFDKRLVRVSLNSMSVDADIISRRICLWLFPLTGSLN